MEKKKTTETEAGTATKRPRFKHIEVSLLNVIDIVWWEFLFWEAILMESTIDGPANQFEKCCIGQREMLF